MSNPGQRRPSMSEDETVPSAAVSPEEARERIAAVLERAYGRSAANAAWVNLCRATEDDEDEP